MAVILSGLVAPCQTLAQSAAGEQDSVGFELSTIGKRGKVIVKARGLTLEILEAGGGCTRWFEDVDPDPAAVFRSLRYEVEGNGPPYVYSTKDAKGEEWFKHPWAARTSQDSGRNSLIRLNANGPFFRAISAVLYLDPGGTVLRVGQRQRLVVGSYSGNTAEAQVATLLHELGHIVGRLPEDDDSWDGRSSRNTLELLRHCGREIHLAVHASSGASPGTRP